MRSPSSPSDAVVIVGGGFGGLFTALALQRRQPNCPIVLVEPRERFLFQPLLYELLSDELQSWEVAPRYNQLLESMEPQQRLAWGLEQFGENFALTTSFGIQSAVLLHMLSTLPGGDAVPVIWIDTGYLPPETYTYADQLTQQLRIRLVVSQSEMSPARMEALHGRLWETGRVDDLETYHRIRKVEPLERSLNDLNTRCWASGVRRGQTDHRRSMTALDPIRERWSLRPLLEWTCLLYTSPSPRDKRQSRMPSSA